MAEFTREQLIERARENVESLKFASTQHAFKRAFPAIEIDIHLAEITLTALTDGVGQEPVGITDRSEIEGLKRGEMANVMPPDFKGVDAGDEVLLYAAPQLPQPAVVPECLENLRSLVADKRALPRRKEWISGQQYSYVLLESVEAMVDDACRAAMLQGAESVSRPSTLRAGWVAVPVDPTEKMVIEGFESVPHPLFQPADWDKYQTMSGCEQAAHRAKLCWAAMIKAAPQQEADNG